MSNKAPIGDKDVLQRRVQANPRFTSSQAVVDSGMTADLAKFMKEKEIKLRKQPGELFSRVSTKAVSEFLHSLEAPAPLEDGGFAHPMDEYRGPNSALNARKMEYLILDCRSAEQYDQCHINGALHYPRVKLNHSTNPFLTEFYSFKNKEGKMLLLYDLEEEDVTEMANIVYQKGIDNVGIIAGGLREFVQDFSSQITGQSPVPIVPRDARMQRRADQVTQARSEARSSVSRAKPKSLSNSLAKPRR